jgi:hypothetical protein
MKPITIIDDGHSKFKLTITITEVRIKLQKETTDQIREKIIDFFKIISNTNEMINCTNSYRGSFRYDPEKSFLLRIQMQTNNKDTKKTIPYTIINGILENKYNFKNIEKIL